MGHDIFLAGVNFNTLIPTFTSFEIFRLLFMHLLCFLNQYSVQMAIRFVNY